MKKWGSWFWLAITLGWLWSSGGVNPEIRVNRTASTVTVFYDGNFVGQAREKMGAATLLKAEVYNREIDSSYFKGSKVQKKIDLPQGDYQVSFRLNNPYGISIYFEGENQYIFGLNPFRHLNSGWIDIDGVLEEEVSGRVEVGFFNGIRWILWLVLKPWPLVLVILGIITVSKNKTKARQGRWGQKLGLAAALLLAGLSVFWSSHLMREYTEEIPHVPDSVSYVILGKLLARGQLTTECEQLPLGVDQSKCGEYLDNWLITGNKQKLIVPYLLGHPLILALGQIAGKMATVPPLVGGGCLVLIYLICFYLTGSPWFSLLSEGVMLVSPFFQSQTIDYMSHNTAALYLLAVVYMIISTSNKRKWQYIAAGFFWGMLLNTRPLTAAAAAMGIFIYEIGNLIIYRDWKQLWERGWRFGLGVAIPMTLYFYYNTVTTGKPMVSPYLYHGILERVGGNDFKLGYGLLHGFTNLATLALFYLRNYYVSFFAPVAAVALWPIIKQDRLKVGLVTLMAIMPVIIWMFYDGNFLMYGPRFIYEATPFFSILLGVSLWVINNFGRMGKAVTICLVILLAGQISDMELRWLGLKMPLYSILFIPGNIKELDGFNYIDDRFKKIYQETEEGVIWMEKGTDWWNSGSGMGLNDFPLDKGRKVFLSRPAGVEALGKERVVDWQTGERPSVK